MTQNNKIIDDAQLDRMLAGYELPAMDESAFDARLFAALNTSGSVPVQPHARNNSKFIFWTMPARFAAVVVLAFLSVIFLSDMTGILHNPKEGSNNIAMTTVTPDIQSERFDVASAATLTADMPDGESFYTEMADQDILLMDYAPDVAYGPYGPIAPDISAQPPEIDQFLDDLLGVESRSL